MKCSLRFCFLSTAFLLVFVMSLLFTYSHHSIAYLDPGGLGSIHRVKLVPGYAGMQRLSKGGPYPRGCICRRCPAEEAGATDWFDGRYDGTVSPVWTKENMDLPPDVQRWWMVSEGMGHPHVSPSPGACRDVPRHGERSFLLCRREGGCWLMPPTLLPPQMLQPQFKSHNTHEVLSKLFQIVPGEDPYRSRDPHRCRRCAVVGNSGNLRGSGYGPEIDGHDFVMR